MNDRCFEWHTSRDLMSSSIVNGREAKRAEFPYIVYIERWDRKDTNGKIEEKKMGHCTGSVINENWILTAAHCFKSYQIICNDVCFYKVYAGIIDITQPGIDYGHQLIILHPNYTYHNFLHFEYDIALIKVKTPMSFSANSGYYRQINSICLPPIDYYNTGNEYAVIAGFGKINGAYNVNRLMMGWNRIPPQQSNSLTIVVNTQYPYPGGAYICFGDSGGPLIQYINGRAVLIGVTSRMGNMNLIYCSPYDATKPVESTYVRVSDKINWILTQINTN
ncbi:venom peptide isomerase heavy chain-like [Oppia nitens]|uniref:venom peptide isomerase heavy chain-like n=1 Tax=Oppia nitens TaxID=1686743 RepID=UPI0023DBC066|nr:venom peptide isomerase heavy chain-like [Oppia nitens]